MLYEWDYSLEVISSVKTFSLGSVGVRGFGIIGGYIMFLVRGPSSDYMAVYKISDASFYQNIPGLTADVENTKIICTEDSVYVKNGYSLKRIGLVYS